MRKKKKKKEGSMPLLQTWERKLGRREKIGEGKRSETEPVRRHHTWGNESVFPAATPRASIQIICPPLWFFSWYRYLKPVLFSPFIVSSFHSILLHQDLPELHSTDSFFEVPSRISLSEFCDCHTAYILIQNIPNMFSTSGEKSFTVFSYSSISQKEIFSL